MASKRIKRRHQRVVEGIADALLDAEEVVGQLDAHDLRYAKGLRLGYAVAHLIARRENARTDRSDAAGVRKRIQGAVDVS